MQSKLSSSRRIYRVGAIPHETPNSRQTNGPSIQCNLKFRVAVSSALIPPEAKSLVRDMLRFRSFLQWNGRRKAEAEAKGSRTKGDKNGSSERGIEGNKIKKEEKARDRRGERGKREREGEKERVRDTGKDNEEEVWTRELSLGTSKVEKWRERKSGNLLDLSAVPPRVSLSRIPSNALHLPSSLSLLFIPPLCHGRAVTQKESRWRGGAPRSLRSLVLSVQYLHGTQGGGETHKREKSINSCLL